MKDYKISKTVEVDGIRYQKGRNIDQSQIPNEVFVKICWRDILEPLDGKEPPNDSGEKIVEPVAEAETETEVEAETE